MSKLKQFFSNLWINVSLVVIAVVGILVYFIKAKNREINALKTELELVETQKQADLLEVEIKEKLEEHELIQKEVDELEKLLVELDNKREKLKEEHANKSATEIEEYWRN